MQGQSRLDEPAVAGERLAGPAEDQNLMRAICDRDRQAFAEFFRRYERRSWARARTMLLDEGLADEVVQVVFLDVWRHAQRYDPTRGAVSAWLATLTHHKAVDVVRREDNHRRARIGDDSLLAYTPDPACSAEVQATRREDGIRVRAAFRQLSDGQRETLFLAYFEHLTYREISQLLDLPLGTVKSRGRVGLTALRGLLQADGIAA